MLWKRGSEGKAKKSTTLLTYILASLKERQLIADEQRFILTENFGHVAKKLFQSHLQNT